jgi:hypothetical protein
VQSRCVSKIRLLKVFEVVVVGNTTKKSKEREELCKIGNRFNISRRVIACCGTSYIPLPPRLPQVSFVELPIGRPHYSSGTIQKPTRPDP